MAPLVLMERKPTAVTVTRVTMETIVNMVNTIFRYKFESNYYICYPINCNMVIQKLVCICKLNAF